MSSTFSAGVGYGYPSRQQSVNQLIEESRRQRMSGQSAPPQGAAGNNGSQSGRGYSPPQPSGHGVASAALPSPYLTQASPVPSLPLHTLADGGNGFRNGAGAAAYQQSVPMVPSPNSETTRVHYPQASVADPSSRPRGGTGMDLNPRREADQHADPEYDYYSSGHAQHHSQPPVIMLSPRGNPTRESLLEEKVRLLEAELNERTLTLERLERENLDRLREVSRIRRESQRQRQEDLGPLVMELQELMAENDRLQMAQEEEVARRVEYELDRIRVSGGVTLSMGAVAGPDAPFHTAEDELPPTQPIEKTLHTGQPLALDETLTRERSRGADLVVSVAPPTLSRERQLGEPEPELMKRNGRLYQGSGPSCKGSCTPLFEDGRAYKFEDGRKWFFYNDGTEYELHLEWQFGPDSRLTAVGSATLQRDPETSWWIGKDIVYPDETKPFVEGEVDGWKSSYSLKPLSDEYRSKVAQKYEERAKSEMRTVKEFNGVVKGDGVQLVKMCLEKRAPFVDLTFPPTQTSICRPNDKKRLTSYAWERPTDFLPQVEHQNICLFDGIDPNDIDQGELGDCWFLCAMASVAEFPELIRRIFCANNNDGAPCYRQTGFIVRLNKHGWWQDVVVDSYLPTIGGRLAFCSTKEAHGELWTSLIEKAYAKLHGSYAAIAGGFPLHGMMDLTGFAGWNITTKMEKARKDVNAATQLFDELMRYDALSYLISVGTPGEDDSAYNVGHGTNTAEMKKKYESAGLVLGHAYSVLKVIGFPNFKLRLVQIRNPWGNAKEWTGEWGDHDIRWTSYPEVRDACKFTKADDGTFWMPFDKMLDYFEDGQICGPGPWTVDCRAKGAFQRGVPDLVLEITVREKVSCMLSLSQKDPRALPENDPCAKKGAMLLTLAVPQAGGGLENTLCSGEDPFQPSTQRTYRYDRDQSLFHTFEPQKDKRNQCYYVVPRIYDHSEVARSYVLSIRVPEDKIKSGAITIRCRRFASDAPPFANYATFDASECGLTNFSTDLQVNFDTKLECGSGVDFGELLQKAVGVSAAAVSVTAPKPAAAVAAFFTPSPNLYELVQRLQRYYRHYCPEKLQNCETISQKYFGDQKSLFQALFQKYGPEPVESKSAGDLAREDSSWLIL